MNSRPEFLICHNGDDVEEASDPLAVNPSLVQIKEEHVDSCFEDVEENKSTIGDIKCEQEVEPDDDDVFENDSFDWNDEPIASPKTELIELDGFAELKPEITSEISAKFNNLPSSSKEHKPKTESEANEKVKEKVQNTSATEVEKPLLKDKKLKKGWITQEKLLKKQFIEGREPKPKAMHKCVFCDKRFVYASDLKRHTRTHVADKGHNCPLCGKSFVRADYREQHLNNVHKGEVVDGVVRKPTYEQKCEICLKVFHHSISFRKHMTIHTGERPFSCTECAKTFRLDQHLQSHMKLVHSDEKSYQCSICGKLFNHPGNYKKHMKIHSGERPFKCFCGKTFSQSSNYQVHMRVHLNEKPHKCDQCEKSFVQAIHLTKHKRIHQKNDENDAVESHLLGNKGSDLRVHAGERPYQCEKCGTRFITNAGLKRHLKKPHNENAIPKKSKAENSIEICSVCGKVFGGKRLLSNHMKIHSGIKPFKCDFCEKCFITLSDCKKHMRIHTGEKPYQCDICQKQFTFSNGYRIHMRNHAGEKPFQCQFCGKAFSCSSDRGKHVKSHTNKMKDQF